MTFPTLMVNLDLGRSNAPVLKAAGNLADILHASVLGIAAGHVMPGIYDEAGVSSGMMQADQDALEGELAAAQAEFRKALGSRQGSVEWRSKVTVLMSPTEYVCREARGVDLVITGSCCRTTRGVNLGDLVMEAGRPVLAVPPTMPGLALNHIVVAWKDTREARRAVLEALPILKAAASVSIVEVATLEDMNEARRRTKDVASWLLRHGVHAEAHPVPASEDLAGEGGADLEDFARERHADLVIAGAYGHSRLREWVLGGFTRSLLANTMRCSMVSH